MDQSPGHVEHGRAGDDVAFWYEVDLLSRPLLARLHVHLWILQHVRMYTHRNWTNLAQKHDWGIG
jgi:hypothetical protein